jgi:hypothetical protein
MGLLNERQLEDIMSNVHVCDVDWFEKLLRMWNNRQTTQQVDKNVLLEKLLEVRESLDYVCEYEFPLNIFVRVDECIAILKGESDGIIN